MEMDLLFPTPNYITVILVDHDYNVSQTTYDLRLVNIKSSSRLEKDTTFISRPHLAISLPLKSSLTKHTEILAQYFQMCVCLFVLGFYDPVNNEVMPCVTAKTD